jgi:hypothetical protein
MNFKQYLAEAASSSASIDVKKFNLDTLIQCYKNAGYEVPANERKLFLASKYEKFNTSGKQHSFIVMMEDDNEDQYYLTRFFVSFGSEGSLIAEPAGVPFYENKELSNVKAKFESAGPK